MVVMVRIALNGYHCTVTYQWLRDGQSLREETTTLLYTAVEGTYTCVRSRGIILTAKCGSELKVRLDTQSN